MDNAIVNSPPEPIEEPRTEIEIERDRQVKLEARLANELQSKREMLRGFLRRKFAKLTPEAEARLASGTLAEIKIWTERYWSASTLDALFKG